MLSEFVYLNAVKSIVESNPIGLNTKQIADQLPEARQRIIELIRAQPNIATVQGQWSLANLPDAGRSRKTVRKYLRELLRSKMAKRVGILHYPTQPTSSDKLNRAIDKLLVGSEHQDWAFEPNVAIYRYYIDPREHRDQIDDFFDSHIPRFANSLFFLDQILEDAIGSGQMSSRVLSPTRKAIDLKLLRAGWERYFGSTKLFILAYAVSPPELLKIIKTKEGSQLAARILAERWSGILTGAKRKQRILETQRRTMEYRKEKLHEVKT
jgi:hypothetical protein